MRIPCLTCPPSTLLTANTVYLRLAFLAVTPAVVAINKHDVNPARTRGIEGFCNSRGAPVVGRIPFDTAVTEAMVAGRSVTEKADGRLKAEFEKLWVALLQKIEGQHAVLQDAH